MFPSCFHKQFSSFFHSAFSFKLDSEYIYTGINKHVTFTFPAINEMYTFFFFFFLDNFVATPLRLFLKEKGNRLSPSGFPRGPAYVN